MYCLTSLGTFPVYRIWSRFPKSVTCGHRSSSSDSAFALIRKTSFSISVESANRPDDFSRLSRRNVDRRRVSSRSLARILSLVERKACWCRVGLSRSVGCWRWMKSLN